LRGGLAVTAPVASGTGAAAGDAAAAEDVTGDGARAELAGSAALAGRAVVLHAATASAEPTTTRNPPNPPMDRMAPHANRHTDAPAGVSHSTRGVFARADFDAAGFLARWLEAVWLVLCVDVWAQGTAAT